jgi:hypothetical protein
MSLASYVLSRLIAIIARTANGFDGFATIIALVAIAYAVPLTAAALMNVRGPTVRWAHIEAHDASPTEDEATRRGSVQPLRASPPSD